MNHEDTKDTKGEEDDEELASVRNMKSAPIISPPSFFFVSLCLCGSFPSVTSVSPW